MLGLCTLLSWLARRVGVFSLRHVLVLLSCSIVVVIIILALVLLGYFTLWYFCCSLGLVFYYKDNLSLITLLASYLEFCLVDEFSI